MGLWRSGSTNMDLVFVCIRLPEVVKCSENSSPAVACEVMLDFVKIELCCLGPL